jgi:hypothetical protein
VLRPGWKNQSPERSRLTLLVDELLDGGDDLKMVTASVTGAGARPRYPAE